MAVAITAALVGTTTPQKVQVVVSGLTIGDAYEVTGTWSGGTWTVRAGSGTSTTTQVVLVDVAAPINTPVTYRVTTDSGLATSGAVTVPSSSRYLLQSLDGSVSTAFRMQVNGLSREIGLRSTMYAVPGRRDPVVVMDGSMTDSGSLVARMTVEQSAALRQILTPGGLALLRTDGSVGDLPGADYILITAASGSLLSAVGGDRIWSLSYRVVGDPEPGTVVPTSTWGDFDTAYAGLTWDAFDTEWAGQTWDLFDRTDWTAH